MKILKENPPNIEKIKAKFKLHKGIIFTYGSILYNPDDSPLDDFIIRHEEQHAKQQGDKPEEWWNKYIEDKDFRISQELEAYGEQYKFVKEQVKKRKIVYLILDNLATILSGEIYGNVLTFNEAKCKIKNYANNRK